jgi:predicted ATPase
MRPWWVDLGATVAGPVGPAVAAALALPQVPGRTVAELAAARLGEAQTLLVLDNCEHVAEETAALAERLLEHGARILATSREPLRVQTEHVHRLSGLKERDAVRLFLDRAGVAKSDAAAEIVERLDGLPLAIELAAGKVAWVSPQELARDLHDRLSLLGDGPRTAPVRQRTLEAAIGWSYELLPEPERHVLRRLAVFPGTFDTAAATAVAGAGLPVLTRLADASLLVIERGTGPRHRLLMTVRTFARERLAEAGEAQDAARRHRDHYLAFAARLGANMTGAGLAEWLPRGRREHENLHAALHWSLERGDTGPAFELAAWLGMYWFRVGFVKDGRELLDRVLRDGGSDSPLLPRALVGRAVLANAAGAPDALEVAGEAVDGCEAAGADDQLVYALQWRASALIAAGRLDEARAALARGRSCAESLGDDEGVAFSDQLLGDLHHRAGDLDAAGALLVRARDRFRTFRAPLDAGYTLVDLARVRLSQGRAADALQVALEALADFRRREDPRGLAAAFVCLGRAYEVLGEPGRARPPLEEALALADRWGFPPIADEAVSVLGQVRREEAALRVETLVMGGSGAGSRDVVEERDLQVRPGDELR